MATVIDSLLIELGLDASKFNTSQKKSVEQLKKFDDQSNKTFKNTQRNVYDLGEGFDKARDALMSLGLTLLSVKGFASIIKDTTTTNANIGRTAQLFNMSARELDAWGQVMKSVGGDASDFQNSMQSIKQGLAAVQFGDTAILKPLALLGAGEAIDLKNQQVDVLKLADAIKQFKDQYGEESAFLQAQAIGVNREMFMVLKEGSDSVRRLYQEAEKGSGVTKGNTEAAEKLQKQWGDVSRAYDAAANEITDQLNPSMIQLAKLTENSLRAFVSWDKSLDGALTTALAFAAGLGTVTTAMKALGVSVPAWFSTTLGAGALGLYSKGLNEGEEAELAKMRKPSGGRTPAPEETARLTALESKYNLPPGMLDKIWNIESGRGENMVSPAGATGHFQFMPKTAAEYGLSREDTFDFEKSSEAAAKKLAHLMKYYSGSVEKAVAAYNWGEGNLDKFGLQNAPVETRSYIQKYKEGVPARSEQAKPLPLGTPMGETAPAPATTGKPPEKAVLNKFWNESVKDWQGYANLLIKDEKTKASSEAPILPEKTGAMTNAKSFLSESMTDWQGYAKMISNANNRIGQAIWEQLSNVPIGSSAAVPANAKSTSTNIENNIGAINVNTPATDGKGIVRDMDNSIRNNSLMTFGLAGPR